MTQMEVNQTARPADAAARTTAPAAARETQPAKAAQPVPCKAREKLVTIRLHKDRENAADVFVSVNNRTWLIQRGVKVQVPECVAEVLRHQEEMLEEMMAFEEAAQNRGSRK